MIHTEKIEYTDSENTYEGTIAYNLEIKGKRPVVMIAPTVRGVTGFEENKAVELAKLGYLGFTIDNYGKANRKREPEELRALMNSLNTNRQVLLNRMQNALQTAKKLEWANPEKIAAIGFCFGGKSVLDLARSGEKIKGIVSLHGVFDEPEINRDKKINCSVLVLHGWEDPLAPQNATVELANELTRKGADWEINAYGHTGHAFTNPDVNLPEKGFAYNAQVNKRAWIRTVAFLKEIFENK